MSQVLGSRPDVFSCKLKISVLQLQLKIHRLMSDKAVLFSSGVSLSPIRPVGGNRVLEGSSKRPSHMPKLA